MLQLLQLLHVEFVLSFVLSGAAARAAFAAEGSVVQADCLTRVPLDVVLELDQVISCLATLLGLVKLATTRLVHTHVLPVEEKVAHEEVERPVVLKHPD